MRWRRVRLGGAASVVALTALLVGCSPAQPSAQPATPGTTATAVPGPSNSTGNDVRDGRESPAGPIGVLSQLLHRRDENRRQIHDAAELVIADCMNERGFRYTPRPYPGSLGENPDWVGLSPQQIDQWVRAYRGRSIPPTTLAEPDRISDPTILVAKGPVSTVYLRRDACLAVGRAAVYGNLAGWLVAEQVVDHLVEKAIEQAGGDEQRQFEREARIAAQHRGAVERFSQLQDRATARAGRLLRQPK
ncbi:MAG: hypothetical protein QM695_13200 [Micropruina sp.]